jgi:hypothetical protein
MTTHGAAQDRDPEQGSRAWARQGEGSFSRRRAQLDRLRLVAVQLETATVLERRASRSGNEALAGVLRERAAQRRRTAERVWAGLLPGRRPPG